MTAITPKYCFNKIGPELIQKVAKEYGKYSEAPTAKAKKDYLTWRLRIHLRCNAYMRTELEIVNEHFNLGLNDTDPGPLMWDYQG